MYVNFFDLITQGSACSLGIPYIYDTQIKGCFRYRNINYRLHNLRSFINDLLYVVYLGWWFFFFFYSINIMSSPDMFFQIFNQMGFVLT